MRLILLLTATSLVSAALVWLGMWLALIPWRRSAGQHWTERARLLWPARRSVVVVMPATGLLVYAALHRWGMEEARSFCTFFIVAGTVLGTFLFSREIEPRYRFREWAGQTFWSIVVMIGPVGIGVWLFATMPEELDWSDGWRVTCGLVAAAIIFTGVWLPLVVRRESSDGELAAMRSRLEGIASKVAEEAGVSLRHVWLLRTPLANACAFPFLRAVAFTTRAMEVLDDEECEAIMWHEVEHLTEPMAMRWLRVLRSMRWFAFIFVNPIFHAWGPSGLLLPLGIVFAIGRFTGWLFRRMEERADRGALDGAGGSPAYASGLAKLYEAGQIPAVMPGKRMVHPHLYDRMVQAGVTPDFPRPAAPSSVSWAVLLYLLLSVVTLFGSLLYPVIWQE